MQPIVSTDKGLGTLFCDTEFNQVQQKSRFQIANSPSCHNEQWLELQFLTRCIMGVVSSHSLTRHFPMGPYEAAFYRI